MATTTSKCKVEEEKQKDPPSLSKATPGTKKAERKWHSRASSIPKAVVVRRSLLSESVKILEQVNSLYGIGDAYLDDVFGRRVDVESGNRLLMSYMRDEGLEGSVQVKWSEKLSCTACMATSGSPRRLNKPHRRKYTLFLNSTHENMYLREHGLAALANHEIGTHYYRARNDGFQVWYPCRTKFGMCPGRCYEMLITEEGLATLNTYLSLKCKLLWKPALSYYTAHMAQKMDTDELFSHIERYVLDPDIRRKIVLRAKRSHHLKLSRGTGSSHSGCGWDQCYFIGAVKILRQLGNIDLTLMHSGKLSLEDCERVGRLAKTDILKLPQFISTEENVRSYCRALAEIKTTNFV